MLNRLGEKVSLRLRDRRGQGMTEYIIIVVVIAVLSIAVVTIFGDQIRDLFHGATAEMSGKDASVTDRSDTSKGEVDKKMDSLIGH
jgi:pilus assembly protein Flp/PilA